MTAGGGQHRHHDPVVRFLGAAAARTGPFGVLGLPVLDLDDDAIVRAVHARMATIDQHPEARTPAADEARLAVHTAAANLLDRGVRLALLEQLGAEPGAGPGHPPPDAPPALAKRTPGSPGLQSPGQEDGHAALRLQADLLRSIGAAGGWGPQARDRFIRLAHARGVDTHTAVRAILRLGGRVGGGLPDGAAEPGAANAAGPSGRTGNARSGSAVNRADESGGAPAGGAGRSEPGAARSRVEQPEEWEEQSSDSLVTAVIRVSALLVLMVLVGGVTLLVLRSDPAPPSINTPLAGGAERSVAPSPKPEQPGDTPEPEGRALDNGPAVLHELGVATDGVPVDPEGALQGFEQAVEALGALWGVFDETDRLAAQDLIVGFVYSVSGQRWALDRAFRALAGGLTVSGDAGALPDNAVWRRVWSMGTLVRLRREENLPGSFLRAIDSALLEAPGRIAPNASTFRAGAVAALRALAEPLGDGGLGAGEPEQWDAWVAAVQVVSGSDKTLAGSTFTAALDARLRHPSRNESGDAAVVAVIAGAMDWSPGSPAREWLVRVFDDRTMGSTALHALTLALANSSGAGGVNHGMVLSRGAADQERRALGLRYRELWGISAGQDRGEALAGFVHAALGVLESGPVGRRGDETDVMASVVRTARLNAAAAMLWRAEPGPASALVGDLEGPIEAVLVAGIPDLAGLLGSGSGTWAEEYLSAGSHIQLRLDLLGTAFGRSGRLGSMDAEVIVTEAFRGTPLRVRDAAAAVIEARTDQPAVVNAVLETLPMIARTDRNAVLVELVAGTPLPPVDDKSWPLAARRAVVERLLELIAGHGEYARLDALAGLLGEAYAVRSGAPAGSTDASENAGRLVNAWLATAARRPPAPIDGISVEEIEGRLAARLSSADGLVQTFHARQLALAETMAQVIAGEDPGRVRGVREILERLTVSRARAVHVLEQVEQTERAMLRFWLLRLGEGVV